MSPFSRPPFNHQLFDTDRIRYVDNGVPAVAVGCGGLVLMLNEARDAWMEAERVDTDEDLWHAAFPDALHGFAVGEHGSIVRTEDGGRTWQAQDSGVDVTLYQVMFVSPELGAVIGDGAVLLVTSNAGRTWTQLEPTD